MRKTDLTPLQPPDPDRLDCEYVINPYDQTGPLMCKFCRENKGSMKRQQECPTRLRWALGGTEHKLEELQDQFDVLKAEALAAESLIRCTCIQTHAPTCQAITRPIDLTAPWVGMRFWRSMPVNGWTECQVVQTTRGVIYFSPVARPNEGHSLVRTIWDHNVAASQIKTVKP